MKDRFGATNPRAQQLRFHTQTAGSTLTAQQPDNNIVRVAVQAMAAVLGGTQSLHTNGRDEALALPTEDAARIALRTQQIIGHESGVANTIDPFAGSYHIEKLTDRDRGRRARAADAHRGGGRHAGGDRGRLHPAAGPGVGLQGAARRSIPAKRSSSASTGTSTDEASTIEVFQVDPKLEAQQGQRVQAVRASRDQATWQGRARRRSASAAQGSDNLVPPIIAAVEAQRHRRRDRGYTPRRCSANTGKSALD